MYSELYKAWKSEKQEDLPQPLPSDFYRRAKGYLKGLEADSSVSDAHTLQGRLLQKETETARRLLNELKELRNQRLVAVGRLQKERNRAGGALFCQLQEGPAEALTRCCGVPVGIAFDQADNNLRGKRFAGADEMDTA